MNGHTATFVSWSRSRCKWRVRVGAVVECLNLADVGASVLRLSWMMSKSSSRLRKERLSFSGDFSLRTDEATVVKSGGHECRLRELALGCQGRW